MKKTKRFDVFKRDSFSCGYCGRKPPEVTLEVDHINPKSLGGDDDINNLITACFDCNRGKRDKPLDNIPSSLVENLATMKEKAAQVKEYNKFLAKIQKSEDGMVEIIANIYFDTFGGWALTEKFKKITLRQFLRKLPLSDVEEAMYLACDRVSDPGAAIKYFCGICWNKIKGI